MFGSLGIGVETPFFEFGGSDWSSYLDFDSSPATKHDATGWTSLDCHVWLQDDNDCIYDVKTSYVDVVKHLRNKTVHQSERVIAGESRSTLAQKGLHYIPAPPQVQDMLHSRLNDQYTDTRFTEKVRQVCMTVEAAHEACKRAN